MESDTEKRPQAYLIAQNAKKEKSKASAMTEIEVNNGARGNSVTFAITIMQQDHYRYLCHLAVG